MREVEAKLREQIREVNNNESARDKDALQEMRARRRSAATRRDGSASARF